MNLLLLVAAAHPASIWGAAAAAFLAVEAATGSGYLLWAAAAAALVAVLLSAGLRLDAPAQAASFAAATAALTFAAQPWLKRRRARRAPDRLNQPAHRLVGREGVAAQTAGRVSVDGQEWAAVFEGAVAAPGAPVRVVAVLGGAQLRVAAL